MTDSDDGSSTCHESERPASHPRRMSLLSRVASAASGRSLTMVVSEVRDGIQNQRDPDRGNYDDEEKQRQHQETQREAGAAREKDPNMVGWDGPDDPQNPKLWPIKRKWAAVICGMYTNPLATYFFLSLVFPQLPSYVCSPDLPVLFARP